MKFQLTRAGQLLQAKIQSGGVLHFLSAEGAAGYSHLPFEQKELTDMRQVLQMDKIERNEDTVIVTLVLSNLEITEEYILRQIGIYAQEPDTGEKILYLIGQDEKGERVPAVSFGEVEYVFQIHLKVSDAAEVLFNTNVNDFLRKKVFYDFVENEFQAHVSNKNNPHKVTKEQVGLSNVPNVATNDQTPTYGIASMRENLSSGEKLSTAFGKIRRWFADLKAVAFSGSYQDLTNKPTSLPANGGNADMVDGFHGSDLFIKNKLNNSTKGLTLDDNADTWVPFKSYRTTSEGKFSAALAVSYNGGGAIEVRDETDGTAGTITSRLELQQNGDIKASTGRIIANGGNADTVDGYHADNLMVYKTNSFNGDIDALISTCTLYMQGATSKTIPKSPDKNENVYYGYLTHINGLDSNWQYQLIKTLSGSLYYRQMKNGKWETAWTAANDNGNAETARRLNSTIPGTAFSNPQLKGDLKGFNYTYEETLPGTAEHEKSPQPNAQTKSWNIINLAYATNRAAQIAIQTFRTEQKMYFRGRHVDNDDFSTWQEWKELFTSDRIANNLATTAAGYALDARQGKLLNDRMNGLFTSATSEYTIFYPEKDYTVSNVGSNADTQGYGYLNVNYSSNFKNDLYAHTLITPSSANCTNVTGANNNFITVLQSGLYQIEVKFRGESNAWSIGLWLNLQSGNSLKLKLSECSAESGQGGSTNIIQYLNVGSTLHVRIEANVSSGGVKINALADSIGGIFSGIFIKKLI